ncbi:LPS assembly lipoprotein LptE [Marinagarivorans cellulosilyticus]|uniref:LPS-assembly lipoprotein LptE n=1 Tax=Marinagarivorans cellulosilyticus TaxID=2721545 RepID=A0AAN1WGI7_9GAMM|nr:LPS assembly lipoprotein LptE [Marinagarivorans cellulosilyticus]BCD97169.1 LPS-assembly lipoprotein [Marinagarivorans cellulosilyticus]
MPSATPRLTSLRFALIGLLALTITACGWQLRGFNKGQLPPELALKTADPYAAIARQLQQTLVRRGVKITPSAPLTLWLDTEELEKRTVAVTSIGAAAQYELRLEIAYSYTPKGAQPALPTTLTTQRVYDFIPGTNLAKAEEQQTLVKEMRQELINRILLQSMSHTNTLTVPAQSTQSTSAHTSSSHGTH